MSIALQARVTEMEARMRLLEARLAEIEKHEQQRALQAHVVAKMPEPPKKEKKHWL